MSDYDPHDIKWQGDDLDRSEAMKTPFSRKTDACSC